MDPVPITTELLGDLTWLWAHPIVALAIAIGFALVIGGLVVWDHLV